MAGVLERMRRSRKKLVSQHLPLDTIHPKLLELLAETFGVSVLEVEEMILLRCEEKELWPKSFSLE
jgi:hypothetical protein